MTASILYNTVSPSLIITTPTQLMAAYAMLLESIGMDDPEKAQVAAINTELLINNLRKLNGQ